MEDRRAADSGGTVVAVRKVTPADDLSELTALLHAAYKELADAGLNFTATDQSEETTRHRLSGGVGFVAEARGTMVGTALLGLDFDEGDPPLYSVPGTGVLCQFGVVPEWRRRGVGDLLLGEVETEARSRGLDRLALDTAEPAVHLVEYYGRRGFTARARHQWPGMTYQSVVMVKDLTQ